MRSVENKILNSPYGGDLINLLLDDEVAEAARSRANSLPSIQLSERSLCDLELLAVGAFSPLDRFLGADDYQSVLETMRLTSGILFPIPITLPVDHPAASIGDQVALRDRRNDLLAILTIEELYPWDRRELAEQVFRTKDPRHPLVAEMEQWGELNASGRLEVLQLPHRLDFSNLRLTPLETRRRLEVLGRHNVVAFQTRNPLHRAHEELTKRAVEETDGVLLLHPVVGMTKPGDVDHFTRVRTYKALVENYYEPDRILLALLPLAMRMAGPREAIWHALIRRNYGASHMIVGRDHASPGRDSKGNPFYGPYEAQEMLQAFGRETGMEVLPFRELVYLSDEDRYEESGRVPADTKTSTISGTQVREEYLGRGRPLPEWFTRREVARILADAHPPLHQRGVCIWFTGLSGAGKSTTAEILIALLLEQGRQVTLLDGDVVRTHLSRGLGFSKEDRDQNVRRIGFVASEIVRHGGVAICAAVSPYRATRNDVRRMIGSENFVEVYVDTPLEVCENRDTKGMYARARRGEIAQFTGVSDPYEEPIDPELTIGTRASTAGANAARILDLLIERGFVVREPRSD